GCDRRSTTGRDSGPAGRRRWPGPTPADCPATPSSAWGHRARGAGGAARSATTTPAAIGQPLRPGPGQHSLAGAPWDAGGRGTRATGGERAPRRLRERRTWRTVDSGAWTARDERAMQRSSAYAAPSRPPAGPRATRVLAAPAA